MRASERRRIAEAFDVSVRMLGRSYGKRELAKRLTEPHDPVVRGTGSRCEARCRRCDAEAAYALVESVPIARGSRAHVNRAARRHRAAHR